ncbi:MAG: DUF1566 domain-containing protein [Gammaproteobacteria bacterium]|nr:DUF1566 domain-containing protein [Gammaproteobacteria bacterium]
MSTPTLVVGEFTDDKGVSLSWESVSGADKYSILWHSSEITENSRIEGISSPFVFEPQFGKEVTFSLEAANKKHSRVSDEKSVLFVPAKPGFKSINIASNRHSLSWDAIESSTSYKIYSSSFDQTFENARLLGETEELSFDHDDVASESTIHYYLVARNPSGDSFPSDALEVNTADIPQKPEIPEVMTQKGENILTWSAVGLANSYKIYFSFEPDSYDIAEKLGETTEKTLTHQGVKPLSSIYYYLVASNAKGDSFPSDAAHVESAYYQAVMEVPLNKTGVSFFITEAQETKTDGKIYPQIFLQEPETFKGQDGVNHTNTIGTSLSFTKLDNSGATLSNDHTDTSTWNCTRDNNTGLHWEVKSLAGERAYQKLFTWFDPNENTNGGNSGMEDPSACAKPYLESNTLQHIQIANSEQWCGFSDWRLPTIEEIRSIVDYGVDTQNKGSWNLLDSNYFPNIIRRHQWTSISSGIDSERAYGFHLSDGSAEDHTKHCTPTGVFTNSAMLVRSPDKPSLSFSTNNE